MSNIQIVKILVLLIAICLALGTANGSKSENLGHIQRSGKNHHNLKSDVKVNDNIYKQTHELNNGNKSNLNNNAFSNVKTTVKRWQVGRVSRKHYEIVNMLWRKTKIFGDTETTTSAERILFNETKIISNQKSTNTLRKLSSGILTTPTIQPSTPSYIEFYYLEDSDEGIKRKNYITNLNKESKNKRSSHIKNIDQLKIFSHAFAFHIDDFPQIRSTFHNIKLTNKRRHDKFMLPNIARNHLKRMNTQSRPMFYRDNNKSLKINSLDFIIDGTKTEEKNIYNKTTSSVEQYNPSTEIKILPTSITDTSKSQIKSSSTNDRIKFFEIYDKQSEAYDFEYKRLLIKNDTTNSVMDINQEQKILLEHVNQNIGHHNNTLKLRYEKKDIHNIFDNTTKPDFNYIDSRNLSFLTNITVVENRIPILTRDNTNMSRAVSWRDYPFVAVYVHEPSQVHCDAAAISLHWLLAAASCLSRHDKEPRPAIRSAFVAYCGANWRQPERIAYVKYSLIHPDYHPKNRNRRYNFNIGLIQVASSMGLACPGWSPISLMSHQFTTESKGSVASAIGWGLDRYGTRYESKDLPNWPLMLYEGLVYSHSCPGNVGYSEAKNEDIVKNVYCLSLPVYYGEENDPVHGGMLLIGGKLIALYLQVFPWTFIIFISFICMYLIK